jgi:hypothetical protein
MHLFVVTESIRKVERRSEPTIKQQTYSVRIAVCGRFCCSDVVQNCSQSGNAKNVDAGVH